MTSAAACRAVRYLLHIFKFFFNIGKTVFPIKCVFYIKQLYLFAITDHCIFRAFRISHSIHSFAALGALSQW